MTPNEKLRIAVAEAEGYKFEMFGGELTATPPNDYNGYEVDYIVPKYTTDRNAIIGAIERMSEDERYAFSIEMLDLAQEEFGNIGKEVCFTIITVPPETLCRLYLKAKGIDFEES